MTGPEYQLAMMRALFPQLFLPSPQDKAARSLGNLRRFTEALATPPPRAQNSPSR